MNIDLFPTLHHYTQHKQSIQHILENVVDEPSKYRHKTKILHELPLGSKKHFEYMPLPIQEYIVKKKDWIMKRFILQAYTNIPKVTLFFVYDENDDMNDKGVMKMSLNLIKSWFGFLSESLKFKTDKELEFYIYFTPFEKQLPALYKGEPLTAIHVNAGYHVVGTQYIYIYRREEWFKLFLHESLHAFESDEADNQEGVVETSAILMYRIYGEIMENPWQPLENGMNEECEHVKDLIQKSQGDALVGQYVLERWKRFREWGKCRDSNRTIYRGVPDKSLRGSAMDWTMKVYSMNQKKEKRRRHLTRKKNRH